MKNERSTLISGQPMFQNFQAIVNSAYTNSRNIRVRNEVLGGAVVEVVLKTTKEVFAIHIGEALSHDMLPRGRNP
jgi:hypothetical protein